MKPITRRLRIATSPMVLAVALGLLGSAALGDEDEDEVTLSNGKVGAEAELPAEAPASSSSRSES